MYESAKIAEKIKDWAKTKDIFLKDMLLELDLNKNTFSNMYKGSMLKADSLAKIADYLSCSVDYLLGRTNNPNIKREVDRKNFSSEDFELLSIFHELSKEQKIKCLAYLKGFVDNENSKQNSIPYNFTEKVAEK